MTSSNCFFCVQLETGADLRVDSTECHQYFIFYFYYYCPKICIFILGNESIYKLQGPSLSLTSISVTKTLDGLHGLNFFLLWNLTFVIFLLELSRRGLFLFCKRSLPVLTVDTIIGNQASSHDRSNIFSVSF